MVEQLPTAAELRRTAEVLMQISNAARAAGRENIALLASDVAAWVPETPAAWRERYPPRPPKVDEGGCAAGGASTGTPEGRATDDEDRWTW